MKAFTPLALFATVASFLPSALAHGFVSQIDIDGKVWKGPKPWSKPGNFAIWQVKNTEPNHLQPTGSGDKQSDLACGRGAANKGAKVMAQAKPGSKITVVWDAGNGDAWPHELGPVITYIGKCIGECSQTNAADIEWFKLHQVGKEPGQGNKWVQERLRKKGTNLSFNLPADMPSGNYVVRHEIIALHLAPKTNGAEFYPACFNVQVSGGSNDAKPSVQGVKFPQAYKLTDPGIRINVWNKPNSAYPFPGPAIVKFTGGSAAAQSSSGGSSAEDNQGSTDDNSGSTDGNTGSTGGNTGSGSSGSTDDNGGEEDCSDEGDNNTDSGSSGSSGSGSGSGSGATKTVTVTVTVTATPTGKSDSKSNSSSDYKKRDMTPLKIRRSRAHLANAHQRP